MVKRLGLPLVGVFVAAAVLVAGAGAIAQPPAHHAPDFTTRAGVVTYLKSVGVNPNGFVIQRGQHNYAGPSCPGVGWSCTMAKHVVQVNYPTNNPGNTNQFTCTPSSDAGPYDCL